MKIKENRINMRRIAKELGISPMTVSRALNGSPLVKDETRNRILSQVNSLGYDFENRLHRLREEKRKSIAIHCGEEKTSGVSKFDFYVQLHYFCLSRIRKMGYIANTIDLNSNDAENLPVLSRSCALILLSPLEPQAWDIIKDKFPSLKIINMFGEVEGVTTITPDEVAGGEIAGRHIASKGHRHVGVFADLAERSFLLRYAGFIAGVKSISRDSRIDTAIFTNSADKEEADKLKEKILDEYFTSCGKDLPTAFFVPNCYAAVYLCNYLKKHGIRIPEDIGVIGYDNNDYYRLIDRQISRVYFDVKELAVQAVDMACALINKDEYPLFSVALPVKFTDCNSVLPVEKMERKK